MKSLLGIFSRASPRIFISYRRGADENSAARTANALKTRYGADSVTLDVWDVTPGMQLREAIVQMVGAADILIMIIGQGWLERQPDLMSSEDYVRLELRTAFENGIPVVPIFVPPRAKLDPDKLPPDIAQLSKIVGIELVHADFEVVLLDRLGAVLRELGLGKRRMGPLARWGSVGLGTSLIAVAIFFFALPGEIDPESIPPTLGENTETNPGTEFTETPSLELNKNTVDQNPVQPVADVQLNPALSNGDCVDIQGADIYQQSADMNLFLCRGGILIFDWGNQYFWRLLIDTRKIHSLHQREDGKAYVAIANDSQPVDGGVFVYRKVIVWLNPFFEDFEMHENSIDDCGEFRTSKMQVDAVYRDPEAYEKISSLLSDCIESRQVGMADRRSATGAAIKAGE